MEDTQLLKGILEGCVLGIIKKGETIRYLHDWIRRDISVVEKSVPLWVLSENIIVLQ